MALLTALAVMLWIGCYLRIEGFGLDTDDFGIIAQVAKSWQENWTHIQDLFSGWGAHARPLGRTCSILLSTLAWNAGGMTALHLLGYGVLLLNTLLFYVVVRHFGNRLLAFTCAAAYMFCPADAGRQIIVHTTWVQFSLTCFFLATITYQRQKRVLPYLFLVLSMIIYETVILAALCIPLLSRQRMRDQARRAVTHVGVLAGIGLAGLVVRMQLAPGRLSDIPAMSLFGLVGRVLEAVMLGMRASLTTHWSRVAITMRHLDACVVVSAGLIFTLFACMVLRQFAAPSWNHGTERRPLWRLGQWVVWITEEAAARLRIVVAGVLVWVTSYALFITTERFPPTMIFGRLSSVHAVGGIGTSLILGTLVYAAVRIVGDRRRLRVAATLVTSFYLTLLASFHLAIQQDCVDSWRLQQRVWRDITELTPDAGTDTVVVVDGLSGLNKQVPLRTPFGWPVALVLSLIYRYPKEIAQVPIVMDRAVFDKVAAVREGVLYAPRNPTSARAQPVAEGNLILIRITGAGLERVGGEWEWKGHLLKLKPVPQQWKAPNLSPGVLYAELIGPVVTSGRKRIR
ncbi:MAG: hypothetical protein AB1486_04140 [Planctomycetota bacterium]